MDLIAPLVAECRTATAHDRVFNGECVYTFHSPYTTPQGLVVNLRTFVGTTPELAFAGHHGVASTRGLFLRIVKERVARAATGEPDAQDEDDPSGSPVPVAAPTKLALGVEGGFATDADKFVTKETRSVVLLERAEDGAAGPPKVLAELPYTEETRADFPLAVATAVDAVLHHSGALLRQDVQQWQLEEEIPVSKYAADLPFEDNGATIDPSPGSWRCQRYPDAERATENLWLNLSDGFVGGGRRNWDGSGGTGGALEHYQETGSRFPLVVKLGTITADVDTADCYSYAPDEDGPVRVPNLRELLEKRGIHIVSMQKTVKSTAELEVELNASYAFDAITEAGAHLVPASGPGLQGLVNLGNSCYMNSVLQMLFSGTVPELARRYGTSAQGNVADHPLLKLGQPAPWDDLLCQTTKVACALTSGAFALPVDQVEADCDAATDPKYRLAPRMFKHVIGKDHVDFCTAQQQDAAQFFQYLLEKLDQSETSLAANRLGCLRAESSSDPYVSSHLFSFSTRTRLECCTDKKVKYREDAPENIWSVRIPMEKAVMLEEKKDDVQAQEHKRHKSDEAEKKQVPTVSFSACLEDWGKETVIDDMQWSHLQKKCPTLRRTRFLNFPRYLVVQMQRYQLGADWTPVKLEVKLDIAEEIDLSTYQCSGPQESEELVVDTNEEETAAPAASGPVIDEAAVLQLMDMGFSMNSCRRALMAVGGTDMEAAMNWIFEHNTDPDFNDPLPEIETGGPPTASAKNNGDVDESVVQSLAESLGCFSVDHVRVALKEANGAMDRAADWLFSHMDDMDSAIAALQIKETAIAATPKAAQLPLENGSGVYTMIGMISHIGKNTGSGHYVAHLKKGNDWVIFNDEKVALSSKPPTEHAYMYLFKRKDTDNAPHPNY